MCPKCEVHVSVSMVLSQWCSHTKWEPACECTGYQHIVTDCWLTQTHGLVDCTTTSQSQLSSQTQAPPWLTLIGYLSKQFCVQISMKTSKVKHECVAMCVIWQSYHTVSSPHEPFASLHKLAMDCKTYKLMVCLSVLEILIS